MSQNIRDSKLLYGENQRSLSHLGFDRYRVVTDRHRDRITNTRYSYMLAVVRKNETIG